MQELRTMISELQMLLEQEHVEAKTDAQAEMSRTVAAKFYKLGHKVNLLALKSDLVLSGADFGNGIKAQ